MSSIPLHLLAPIVAGWIGQRQQESIDYLREENRVLREKLGPKRIPYVQILSRARRAALR
jgi:hypothetical protein